MELSSCSSCQKPKAQLQCGSCHEAVCKKCAHFLEEGAFSFSTKVSEVLQHGVYCNSCFEYHVRAALENYNQEMELAKNIVVFSKSQSKETQHIRRSAERLVVENCVDRDETLLRLAFMAVQLKYNAVLDIELTAKKVKKDGYQTSIWRGTGTPVQLDERKLVRSKSLWDNPN